MAEDVLLSETVGAVRVLTLNRPDKRNAATLEMQRKILAGARAAAADPAIGALVLTGAGPAFSAGGDRAVLAQVVSGDFAEREAFASNYIETIRTFLTMDLPVVAAVNGPAIGYAAGLVALCDFVVMAESAQLCEPHVRFGVPCDLAVRLIWPRQTSVAIAKELLVFGRAVGAKEALSLGLANRVCPDGQALDVALELAKELAAMPPAGVRITKRTFNDGLAEEAERLLAVLSADL
jgi:enoyl-CoA hydratase